MTLDPDRWKWFTRNLTREQKADLDGHIAEFLILATKNAKSPASLRHTLQENGIPRRNWVRQQKREKARARRQVSLDDMAQPPVAPDFLAQLEAMEQAAKILNSLPHDLAQVLVRRYIDDQPYETMAKELGVSVRTVDRRLQRAKKAARS